MAPFTYQICDVKAYSTSTTNEDIVGFYSIALNINSEYERAYNVIVNYFDNVSSGKWKDIDIRIWQAHEISAVMTHRCLDADASATHVLEQVEEGSRNNIVAQNILYNSTNDKEYID